MTTNKRDYVTTRTAILLVVNEKPFKVFAGDRAVHLAEQEAAILSTVDLESCHVELSLLEVTAP